MRFVSPRPASAPSPHWPAEELFQAPRSDWPTDELFRAQDPSPRWLPRIVSEALVAPIGRGLATSAAVDSFSSADFVSLNPQNTTKHKRFFKNALPLFILQFSPAIGIFLYTNSAFSPPCNFADHVSQHILPLLTFYLYRFFNWAYNKHFIYV